MVDINFETQIDKLKESFLWAAAQGGNTEDCESLIEIGADVNWKNADGDSPLLVACRRGHTDTVEALVVHGGDVNISGRDGMCAVHICCLRGDYSTLNILLSANASLSIRANDGRLPLDIAELNGYENICSRIMQHISSTPNQNPRPLPNKHRILELDPPTERLRRGNSSSSNASSENRSRTLPAIPPRDNNGVRTVTNASNENATIPVNAAPITNATTSQTSGSNNANNTSSTSKRRGANNTNTAILSSNTNMNNCNNNNITHSTSTSSYTLVGPNILPGHDESSIALRKQLDSEQKSRKQLESKVGICMYETAIIGGGGEVAVVRG